MELTIEDIKRAYDEIGAVALAGEYFDMRYNVPHCCPMSALFAQKYGFDATSDAIDQGVGGIQDSVAERFAEGLGLPVAFISGFIVGVDGNEDIRDEAEFRAGFELGALFRTQELIGG